MLPAIKKYWKPSFARYIEPFCGSASLYFEILPAQACLSDINQELVDTLRAVQFWPDTVSECLARLKVDEASYYRIRSQDPSELSPAESAARFIYLNMLCFNGLYRVNRAGKFNVPYGSKQRKKFVGGFELRVVSEALSSATIIKRDFEIAISDAVRGDFIYLDPPYATDETRVFTEYDANAFTTIDLVRLRKALQKADQRGVKFVLSYASVPELIDLAKGWSVEKVQARRNIAGFTGSRRHVEEVLISNCEKKDE